MRPDGLKKELERGVIIEEDEGDEDEEEEDEEAVPSLRRTRAEIKKGSTMHKVGARSK